MRHALPIMTVLLLGGCVQLTDTNPVGTAASIAGRWSIDGVEPTRANCTFFGASRIRVSFLDELRPVTHPGLFFQCDAKRPAGNEPGFDSRDGSVAVVAAGCWTMRLDALDAGGQLIATGPLTDVVVPSEDIDTTGCAGDTVADHIVLPMTDFLSGRVVAATELDGTRAGEAACDERGIVDVRLVFDDTGGGRVDALGQMGVTQVSQPCAFGRVAARVMPGFVYAAHLERIDSAGAVTAGAPVMFDVSATGDVCYFGGSCRTPCTGDTDCDQGASETCQNSFCRPASEPAIPAIDLGGL